MPSTWRTSPKPKQCQSQVPELWEPWLKQTSFVYKSVSLQYFVRALENRLAWVLKLCPCPHQHQLSIHRGNKAVCQGHDIYIYINDAMIYCSTFPSWWHPGNSCLLCILGDFWGQCGGLVGEIGCVGVTYCFCFSWRFSNSGHNSGTKKVASSGFKFFIPLSPTWIERTRVTLPAVFFFIDKAEQSRVVFQVTLTSPIQAWFCIKWKWLVFRNTLP